MGKNARDWNWPPPDPNEIIQHGCKGDHPRRCKGKNRKHNRQCKNIAMTGTEPPRCRFHSGNRKNRHKNKPHYNAMSKFYRDALHPTLVEYVERCHSLPAFEQYAVNEELSLARHNVACIEVLYKNTLDAPLPDDPVKRAIAETTRTMMLAELRNMRAEAVKLVANLAATASSIDAQCRDKISVHHIGYIVKQITQVIFDVLGDCVEAHAIQQRIDKEVRMPGDALQTEITPDMIVLSMDATIPVAPITIQNAG